MVKPARFIPGRRRKRKARVYRTIRLGLLTVVIIGAGIVLNDARLVEPPGFLQTDPETVTGAFTHCGRGRGVNCVVDGDTFHIGNRKIRVVGIDTAEKKARCPAEATLAAQSTEALLGWLNRGPFQITARIDDPTDRYGRELRIVKRVGADGAEDSLADFMLSQGSARRYLGGTRGGWC